jgi:hypothetical protein
MISLAFLAAWLLTDLVATYGVIHYLRHLTALAPAENAPRVVILTAIKGVGAATAPFLETLCRQHYPHYRLVFALQAVSDPVLVLIEDLRRRFGAERAIDVVIAGSATQRAQKVHNQLAALSTLRDEDAIVVFADADILPDERWLSQLVRPVANGDVAASSGYRWQLPTDRRWPSLIAASIDMSIATAARSFRWNLCWGGSMALDRSVLDRIDLPSVWNRAGTDDLTLTAALRAGGYKVNAPLHVLVPSPIAFGWPSLFGFARRQYMLLRTYAPRHWLFAGWTVIVPALGAALALHEALNGSNLPWLLIASSSALLQVRLSIRYRIAALLLPPDSIAHAKSTIAFSRWAWPLIHLVHLIMFLASIGRRRFSWAGIKYRVSSKTTWVD